MPVIKVRERDVHFQEMNGTASETVLMLHGMLGNLSVYYFSIAPILAKRFRVIMYDLKGHGRSEKARDGYDLGSMAEDLSSLMDAFRLRTVHLVGYSLGALIVLKAAILFPDRINSLSIIEAPDPSDPEPLEMMKAYAYDKEALRDYIAAKTKTRKQPAGTRQEANNNRLQEFLFTETSIRADMEGEREFFSGKAIGGIMHKTLLIYGRGSDCIAAGYSLSQMIRGSRLVIMEGDHGIPVQDPVRIGLEIASFFTK